MQNIDRRTFLATSIGAALATRFSGTLNAQTNPRRIDVHHHFSPPQWVTEMTGNPLLNQANTKWTIQQSLDDMDQGGVATAIISVTNPGLWIGDTAQAIRLARGCNDYGAQMVSDHPARFGLFAAMPLPDIDATLKEIAYAYDTIKADGISLFTSYGERWLGHEDFRPVMEELNRRKAVVAVHPTAADCCRNLAYAQVAGPNAIEYGTDTTRAIMNLAFSGDAVRYPDIRYIWSHAGGSVPFFAGRIERAAGRAKDAIPNGFTAELKKFYYDTAGAANRGALISLLELVDASHIVFGTDYPPGGASSAVAKAVADTMLFSEAELHAIDRGNAAQLLPRFA